MYQRVMSESTNNFNPEQQSYLQGLAIGTDVARKVLGLPVLSNSAAQGETIALGVGGAALRRFHLPEHR